MTAGPAYIVLKRMMRSGVGKEGRGRRNEKTERTREPVFHAPDLFQGRLAFRLLTPRRGIPLLLRFQFIIFIIIIILLLAIHFVPPYGLRFSSLRESITNNAIIATRDNAAHVALRVRELWPRNVVGQRTAREPKSARLCLRECLSSCVSMFIIIPHQ